jgi:hypothetical protein
MLSVHRISLRVSLILLFITFGIPAWVKLENSELKRVQTRMVAQCMVNEARARQCSGVVAEKLQVCMRAADHTKRPMQAATKRLLRTARSG